MSRIPPYNEYAEKAVLGAIILRPSEYHACRRIVCADDFYMGKNRSVFSAIEAIMERGDAVDAVTIHTQTKAVKGWDVEPIYLSTLTDDCLPSHGERYAGIVRALSRQRAVISAGQEIVADGYNLHEDPEEYVRRARQAIISACEDNRAQSARPVSETIGEAVSSSMLDEPPKGVIMTGIPSMDSRFGGLWPGLMCVLAARPAMGKTALALNIAVNAALTGKKVLFVSLEDIAILLQYRIIARFANVDSRKIRDRNLSPDERSRILGVMDRIASLPLWIDDQGGKTSDDVRRSVLAHADRNGVDLVVVDHLQHMADKARDSYTATTNAVRTMGEVPKEIGRPLLLLCQLNRGIEKRTDRIPTMSDLRDSGKIEEVARMILFANRPIEYDKTANPYMMNIVCSKNTHGVTGMVDVHADMAHMHITDWNEQRETPGYVWAPTEGMRDGY
jgi:replicative DNA helicase